MKQGWTYKKLGDIAEIIHGKNQKDVISEDGRYPIYGSGGNVMGYATDYLCEANTTILGRKGSINNPQFITERFWNVDTAFGIFAKNGNDSKFIYYFIKSIDWSKKNTGTTLPSLTQQVVKSVELSVPPLAEQERIVERLDAAFAQIDELKSNAEKQLAEARALFQSALTQAMQPKPGWQEKTLGEIAIDMYRGSGIRRDQITKEGFPCVRYGEIYTTYNISFEDCVSHTLESSIASPKYFEHGDLLFAITGESVEDIGKTIAYMGNEKCLLGGDIICMKHKQNPKFLSYALSTTDAIKQKGFGKTKLKVVHTNAPSLKAIRIPLPPLFEQQSIVEQLDSISTNISLLEEINQKIKPDCDAMKQALLRQIFE